MSMCSVLQIVNVYIKKKCTILRKLKESALWPGFPEQGRLSQD